MKIGLLYPTPDPLSPAMWSGSPHGLAGGFAELGVEVVPIGVRLPLGIHQAVAVLSRIGGKRGAVADRTVVRQVSRTLSLAKRLRAEDSNCDAVVAMGIELYDLAAIRPEGVPFATFDDGTLFQQWQNPDSDIRQSGFQERDATIWFERQAKSARAASVCCVSTEYAAHSFVSDYAVPADRVRVVGMGHRPRANADASPRDWAVPRFLFVGVDWNRKNGPAVVRAFQRVREQYPTATLDLVGEHPPVTLPGVRDHGFLRRENPASQRTLDSLFARSTVFVLPSRFDLSPISYLEAASAGMPVISSTEGGAGEVLGAAAAAVHPDDDDALFAAMLELADSATAARRGAEAYAATLTASWAHVAQRIIDALGLQHNHALQNQPLTREAG